MTTHSRTMRIVSVVIFSVGVALGTLLSGSATLADLEASLFAASMPADASLKTLACPVFITAGETGTVAARISNTAERPKRLVVHTYISNGFVSLHEQENALLSLEPGESQRLEWTITPEDAAWGRFVLVRVFVNRNYPVPARTAACGIVVANLPNVRGWHLFAGILSASLLGMAAGIGLRLAGNRLLTGRTGYTTFAMIALAVVVLAGMVASLMGWWVLGVAFLTLTLLMIISVVSSALIR